jgi:hypothetical protein
VATKFLKTPDIKFEENPFSGIAVASCSQTEVEISVGDFHLHLHFELHKSQIFICDLDGHMKVLA